MKNKEIYTEQYRDIKNIADELNKKTLSAIEDILRDNGNVITFPLGYKSTCPMCRIKDEDFGHTDETLYITKLYIDNTGGISCVARAVLSNDDEYDGWLNEFSVDVDIVSVLRACIIQTMIKEYCSMLNVICNECAISTHDCKCDKCVVSMVHERMVENRLSDETRDKMLSQIFGGDQQ